MPSSTFYDASRGRPPIWSYGEVAGLPLPGPALVIDVRQSENPFDFAPMALLTYLYQEMHDLSREMRQHEIDKWGSLQQCFAFRKLLAHVGESREYFLADPSTWEPGQEPEYCLTERLAPMLSDLIKEVRNQRLSLGDPKQSTVRVIFLVDLAEQQEPTLLPTPMIGVAHQTQQVASFDLAVECANLLKMWCLKEQGWQMKHEEAEDAQEQPWQRANYDAMIETVAVCLNAIPRLHYSQLTEVKAARMLDTLILVQAYRPDYGHLDSQAQISHVELLLSALLLHWPEMMQASIEDTPATRGLPRPVYILGAAAIEYAARWGERWWNYGLEAALLEQLLAYEPIEKQEAVLQGDIERWWSNWRKQISGTLEKLKGHVSQLNGLRALEHLLSPDLFQGKSLADLKQDLVTWFEHVKALYSVPFGGSLPEVLTNAPLLVELGKRIAQPSNMPDGQWLRYEEDLRLPEREAYGCLWGLCVQARGSIPRALRSIELLQERIEHLQREIERCKLPAYLDEWERWFSQALQHLEGLEEGLGPRRAQRVSWHEKKLVQKERQALRTAVEHLQRKHYAMVYSAVQAQYAQTLLAEADLPGPYGKRLQELQVFLEQTRKRAQFLRDVAGLRLALGSQKPLVAAYGQYAGPVTLLNRQDHLNQTMLLRYFEQAFDELSQYQESPALQSLVQATLRFLGPEEPTKNGSTHRQPRASYTLDEQHAQEQIRVLEILLVSAFLASKAGASIAKMEPLLSNYRQAWLRLQLEPGLLMQTIREIEETVRFVQLQKKMYGNGLALTPGWHVPNELPLAAWLAAQPRDAEIGSILDSANLLRYLADAKRKANEIVRQLDEQAVLAGFPDRVSGDEECYLYLPPGLEGESFEQALDQQLRSTVRFVRTANREKMIYLRIHRMRQFSRDDLP